jgi:transcriptional regulator with XRE-family HTH domain
MLCSVILKEGKGQGMNRRASGRVALPYLSAWRNKRFLTQRGLAEASGISGNTINALEQGYRQANYSTLGKLARALGITPEQLANADPAANEQRIKQEGQP